MNNLVKLYNVMQENLKAVLYSEQIQLLTLVPDELVSISHEIEKKVAGILVKPAPKKGKNITIESFHLVTNVSEHNNFSRLVPEKKDYVSVSKGVHKQKLGNL